MASEGLAQFYRSRYVKLNASREAEFSLTNNSVYIIRHGKTIYLKCVMFHLIKSPNTIGYPWPNSSHLRRDHPWTRRAVLYLVAVNLADPCGKMYEMIILIAGSISFWIRR